MGNRKLTPGEIHMVSAIFGDSISYGDVNIYDRGAIGLPLSITAPNGNIYYPGRFANYYSDDFSAPGVHPVARGTFMHEMGHVWQHNQGVNVALERNFNGDYDYSDKLNNNVPFDGWGIEEQAEYLSDVYRAQNGYTLGHSVNQTYTLEELLAFETAIPNLQALVASSSALTSSLRPVGRDDNQCFLSNTPIMINKDTKSAIKPTGDQNLSSERARCLRMLGYGVIHLFLCYIGLYDPDRFSHTRVFPLVYFGIAFGPIAFAIENYVKFYMRNT